MALLDFSGLAFGYSDERVIVEAGGALNAGNIVGLIGANAGGKTTLLRLLLGELSPEAGRVQRARQASLAYVSQTAGGEDGDLLFAFVKAGRSDLAALGAKIATLHDALAEAPEDQQLIRQLGQAEQRFSALGGHRWEHEVERLLLGLSFLRRDFERELGVLSGGQRQKACLARALISSSNCLIFDEPTNHLDLAAQAFLVDYLKALPKDRAVLLVSHDRWLLDQLATHIWELDDGTLYRYPGNYSKYVPLREERRKQARLAFERQQVHIARTEEYIRRNIAGQNTKQARGRRKLLGRMDRLDRPAEDPQLSFVLKPQLRSGEQLLLVENLAFSYSAGTGARCRLAPFAKAPTHVAAGPAGLDLNPPLTVARGDIRGELVIGGLSMQLYRGERLGIVGPNGCGKTTLLRLLTRQLAPLKGMVAWGSNAELGVFSQDSADLSAGNDLLAELRTVEPTITDSAARDYLGRFGFSGDDVFAEVGTLSGGERSRLTLAKIFRRRPNVLIFDEPTNHLDIYAREALEQLLLSYGGTVLMVTHDRALLERVCNRLVVFPFGAEDEQTLTFFRGSYADYLTWRTRRRGGSGKGPTDSHSGDGRPGVAEGAVPDPARPDSLSIYDIELLAKEAHVSPQAYADKQLARAHSRAEQVEQAIADAEEQINRLMETQREADTAQEYVRLAELQDEIDKLKAAIEARFGELEQAHSHADSWQRLSAQV